MLVLLWPICGVLGLWLFTPRWMRHADPIGFALMHVLACIGGLAILILAALPKDELSKEMNRRENAKLDARGSAKGPDHRVHAQADGEGPVLNTDNPPVRRLWGT